MSGQRPEVIVLGLGGQARVVVSILTAQGCAITGLVDVLGEPEPGSQVFGLPVLGGLSCLAEVTRPVAAVAVGDNHLRRETVEKVRSINPATEWISPIHPQSRRENDVRIGSHVTVCLGATLCTAAEVSDGAIVNTGAIVEHECVLGRYSHVCPGVKLGGRVRVGDFAHVGIGATVIDKIRIGDHAVIGAGAVVIDDIPDHATAVGVPAKVIQVADQPRQS